jgi:glycerol-3-phosphate O-acyltransferase
MAEVSGLETVILNDKRVTSEIKRLSRTTEKPNGFLARSLQYALNLVHRRSSEEKLMQLARNYFARMRSAIEPGSVKLTGALAEFAVTQSFSEVHVQGIAEIVETLQKGKVAFYSAHFSYYDVGVLPYVFAQHGVSNVYYIGGENVTRIPVLGLIFGPLLRNSGLIQIQRDLKGKKLLLSRAVLQAYAAYLMQNGFAIHNNAGGGRNRHEVEPVRASVSGAVVTDAESVFPMSIVYDIFPEDREFALQPKRGSRSVLDPLLKLVQTLLNKEPYGDVYIAFGKPVSRDKYAARYNAEENGSLVVKEFEAEVTKAIIRTVTITPTSLLAALLDAHGTKALIIDDMQAAAEQMLTELASAGSNVAPNLKADPKAALAYAASKLEKRGALYFDGTECIIREPKLIRFYAEKAIPTLREFGIA